MFCMISWVWLSGGSFLKKDGFFLFLADINCLLLFTYQWDWRYFSHPCWDTNWCFPHSSPIYMSIDLSFHGLSSLPNKKDAIFQADILFIYYNIFVFFLSFSISLRCRYCHTYIDACTYILYMSVENEQSIVIFCSAFWALMNFCDSFCILHKEGLWMTNKSYTYL